jgi:hypothetical protein
MVDRWLGRVFERLDRYRLWDRTCVIITTDHGHYLGEHGWMGKPNAPLYHTLCHIPLLVWHPDGAHNGKRVAALTQTLDLYATALELLGLEVPSEAFIHSRSFAPVLLARAERAHREVAVYGYTQQRIGVTSGEWTLLRCHDPDAAPAVRYTHQIEQTYGSGFWLRHQRRFDFEDLDAGRFMPGARMPVWRMPYRHDPARDVALREDLLFNNRSDPGQERSVAHEHSDVVRWLEGLVRGQAHAVQAPEDQFRRLQL